MIDNFATFSYEVKSYLISTLGTNFPSIEFMDSAANYSIQDEGLDFKVCRLRFSYWRDAQHLSVNGNLGISLFYGSPDNIEIDSGSIRNFLLGDGQKIFETENYKIWFNFSNDYDVMYYPESREFQLHQLLGFRATLKT